MAACVGALKQAHPGNVKQGLLEVFESPTSFPLDKQDNRKYASRQ